MAGIDCLSRRTIQRFEPTSLGTSCQVVKARTGFESAICLAISQGVLRGFVVVITAPRDMTERHTTGKKMELGESRRMTWPFLTPMLERDVATESRALQSSATVSWLSVEASTKAILPWWARDEMNVVTSSEWFSGCTVGLRLL
jgi:hypothetical protein